MRLQEMAFAALNADGSTQAMEFKGRSYDWGWVHNAAALVSRSLVMAGADENEPVAFVPRNQPSSAAALLGLLASGRTAFMIYAFQSPEALADNITKVGLRTVILSRQDFTGPVVDVVRSLGGCAVLLDDDRGAAPAEGLPPPRAAAMPAEDDEPSLRILTSGTTGAPKHFKMPYSMIAEHVVGLSIIPRDVGNDVKSPTPTLIYFPFSNIAGIYHFLPIAMNRAPVILLEKFDVAAWLAHSKRYRPVIGSLPPAGVQMILDFGVSPEDLAGTAYMNTGAAAIDPTVHRAFEERFGIPLLLSYGATEFGGPVAYFTPELHRKWGDRKFGSVGPAWGGAKLRVVDSESGDVLPPGQEGVLQVVSPRIGPDWIHTTDLAVLDEDGFLFHRGRADGAIVRGGFKLLPEVIEKAIVLHPKVAAAAVVGIRDSRLGQVPVAAVQMRAGEPPLSIGEIEAHIRKHVYATHIPVGFRFVSSLPLTPSMKVDQRKVRALFSERDEAPPVKPIGIL